MEFEQAVINSVQDVFTTMVMLDVESKEPIMDSRETLPSNISGSLGFAGDVTGAIVVHCPTDTAVTITGAFLGMDVEGLNGDVKDAIGELANMIAGGFKDSQASNGIALNISLPTTVIGTGYRISGMSKARRSLMPFTCKEHDFWVELRYQENKN